MIDINTIIAGNIFALLKNRIKDKQILRMLSGQLNRQLTRCLMALA